MKITFVNRMMGIKFGGGENFDLQMARALKRRGHDIRFVIGTASGVEEPVKLDDEFEVHRIETPYFRKWHYHLFGDSRIRQLLAALALEFDLWKFEHKAAKFLSRDRWSDVYQLCGLARLGSFLSRRGERETCSSVVIRWPGPPSRRKLPLMRSVDLNIANGDAYRVIRSQLLPEIRQVEIGVDTKWFCPGQLREKGSVKFLFVGRIVPVKNLPLLVRSFREALKIRPDLKLEIVGDGETEELKHLKRLIEGEKRISLLGAVRGQALVECYRSADVFCLASRYDNYPNVVLEAMACGLPVIATEVGGIPLQVRAGETGILVRSGEVDMFRDAILKMAENEEMRKQMGKAARRDAEVRFSWDRSASMLEELYVESLECAV